MNKVSLYRTLAISLTTLFALTFALVFSTAVYAVDRVDVSDLSTVEASDIDRDNYIDSRSTADERRIEVEVQNDPPVASDEARQPDEQDDADRASYNNARSNRASTVDLDTNVCDGVTCPDGTCAPTRDACGIEDGATDIERTDRRPFVISDVCDDDDSCVTSDDFIIKAQDYNSTRSNRRKNAIGRLECPLITCPDNSCAATREQCEVPATERSAHDGEIEVYAWSWGTPAADTDEEGAVYSWGRGIHVATAAVSHNTSRSRVRGVAENDTDGVATSTRILRALEINGHELRGWSEEERENMRRYQAETAQQGAPEAVAARVTSLVLENERIEDLVVSEIETTMYYRDRLRLFGLIPIERDVLVRGSHIDDMKITYPWYSFLTSKPERENIRTIFSSMSQILNASGGGGAGKVSLQSFDR